MCAGPCWGTAAPAWQLNESPPRQHAFPPCQQPNCSRDLRNTAQERSKHARAPGCLFNADRAGPPLGWAGRRRARARVRPRPSRSRPRRRSAGRRPSGAWPTRSRSPHARPAPPPAPHPPAPRSTRALARRAPSRHSAFGTPARSVKFRDYLVGSAPLPWLSEPERMYERPLHTSSQPVHDEPCAWRACDYTQACSQAPPYQEAAPPDLALRPLLRLRNCAQHGGARRGAAPRARALSKGRGGQAEGPAEAPARRPRSRTGRRRRRP